MTVPNLLTASRIVSTPFLGYMVTHGHFEMALGLFIVAGITDLVSKSDLWNGMGEKELKIEHKIPAHLVMQMLDH